jgi:hypothetical protein
MATKDSIKEHAFTLVDKIRAEEATKSRGSFRRTQKEVVI